MNQSPSVEANRFLTGQEIPRIIWNPTVCYLIYKRSPPVPVLSQIKLFHTPAPFPEDPS